MADKVKDFMGRYSRATGKYGETFYRVWKSPQGNARTLLLPDGAKVLVGGIDVSPADRKKGIARRVMRKVTRLADDTGVTLRLTPTPTGRRGMTAAQLHVWYQSFGFEGSRRGMVRKPRVRTRKNNPGPTATALANKLRY